MAKKLKLRNCTVKRGTMTIEFDGSHSPAKASILHFGGKLSEPFRFEAERNLKIIIELEDGLDSLQQFERAIEILELWD